MRLGAKIQKIQRLIRTVFLTVGLVFCIFVSAGINQTLAASGINKQINYQGKLLNGSGSVVSAGTYSIYFSLYDASSGGNRLWTASGSLGTPAAVNVVVTSEGLFTVLLGSSGQNALDGVNWNSDSIYLGVTVGSDSEMTPRKRLSSAAQAFNAWQWDGYNTASSVQSGDAVLRLSQTSADAATSARTTFILSTSGTSNANDYLLRALSGAGEVFTISRQGSVTTTGDLSVQGQTILGTDGTDTVSINASLVSSLLPDTSNVRNLGSAARSWGNVYASGTVFAASAQLSGSLTVLGVTGLQDLTFANATGTNVTSTNLFASLGRFTTIISTSGTINTFGFGSATGSDIYSTVGRFGTVTSTNLNTNTGTIGSLVANNATATNFAYTSATGSSLHANTATFGVLTVGGQSVCLGNGTNCPTAPATSTWYGAIELDRATSTALAFGSATGSSILSTSGTIAMLGFGSATGTDLFSATIRGINALFTNVTSTVVTSTNLYSNTATIGSLTSPSVTISGGTIDGTTIGLTTPAAAIFTDTTSTNLFATNGTFTNLTVATLSPTNITWTNATGTNTTSTNFAVTGIASLPVSTTINGQLVCLADGTNCPSGTTPSFQTVTNTGNTTTRDIAFAGGTSTGNFLVQGTLTVGSQLVCLADGTNCPATGGGLTWLDLAYPSANNTYSIGSATGSIANLYASGTVVTQGLNFGSATGSSILSTSGTITTLGFGSATGSDLYALVLRGGTVTSTTINGNTVNAGALTSGSSTLGNVSSTNLTFVTATGSSLNSNTATIGAITSQSILSASGTINLLGFGSATGVDLYVGTIRGDNVIFTNVTSTNATSTNLYISNLLKSATVTSTNLYSNTGVIGALIAASSTLTNVSSTNLTFVTASGTTFNANTASIGALTVQSIVSASSTLGNVSSTNLSVSNGITAASGTINLLGFGSATGSDLFSTTLRTTAFSADATGATSTNFYWSSVASGTTLNANVATIGSLTSPNVTISGGTINGTSIGLTTPAAAIFTDTTSTNLFATNGTFTNVTVTSLNPTNIIWTNATGTNTTSTNLAVTGLTSLQGVSFTSATGSSIFSTSGTIATLGFGSATGTDLFATMGRFTTVTSTSILGGTGIFSGRVDAPYLNRWFQNPITQIAFESGGATTTVGNAPYGIVFDGTYMWVANSTDNSVNKIDIHTNTVIASTTVGVLPRGIVFDGTYIWVSNSTNNSVNKIDIHTNQIVASTTVGTLPFGIASDGTNIWVANNNSSSVSKINVNTNAVIATVPVGSSPANISFDGSYIWVVSAGAQIVSKIDINTNTVVATTSVAAGATSIAFDGDYMWVTNATPGNVSKIDIRTNAVVATTTVGTAPRGIAFDGAYMWVVNANSNTVSKIDIRTNAVVATYGVGSSPRYIAFDGAYMWVTNNGTNTLTKIPTGGSGTGADFLLHANLMPDSNNTWNLGSASNSWANIYASGTAYLANATVGSSLTVGGQSVCLANGTNCQATSTWYGAIALDRATSTALAFGSATGSSILSTSGTISLLGFGSATGSDLFSTTLRTTAFSADATGATSTNFYWSSVASGTTLNANVATIGSLTSPNVTISGGSINGTSIGLTTPAAAIFTDTTSTNLFATNGTFTNLTVSSLNPTGITWTNATGTNTTSTNFYTTNLLFGGATGTSLYVSGIVTSTILNANTSTLGFVTINGGAINGTTIGLTTAAAATFTNVTSTNATSTNIYVTNLTTAGITALSANTTIGGTSVCLSNGSNCPVTGGSSDANWAWNSATMLLRPVTSTNSVAIGGTSGDTSPYYFRVLSTSSRFYVGANGLATDIVIGATTATITNTAFQLTGGSLFASGNIGAASSVYTNGAFIAGNYSIYGDGFISVNSALTVSSTAILPSSNNAIHLGSATASWGNIYASGTIYGASEQLSSSLTVSGVTSLQGMTFTNATGTNVTSTNLSVSGIATLPTATTIGGQTVCLGNGTNCVSGSTPTLLSVTNAGAYATATLLLYGGVTTSDLTVTGTASLQSTTFTSATGTDLFATTIRGTGGIFGNVTTSRILTATGTLDLPAVAIGSEGVGIFASTTDSLSFVFNGSGAMDIDAAGILLYGGLNTAYNGLRDIGSNLKAWHDLYLSGFAYTGGLSVGPFVAGSQTINAFIAESGDATFASLLAPSSTLANVSSTNLTFVSATGSSLNANTAAFGVLTVGGQSVCLGSGTNCPATSTWYGPIEWSNATGTNTTSTDLYAGTLRTSSTVWVNNMQAFYIPDQTNFTASIYSGGGGGSSTHLSTLDGQYNTAFGVEALFNSTTGSSNTAVGNRALYALTTGQRNTALGQSAGRYLTTGEYNVFMGRYSGLYSTNGSYNTFIGYSAGVRQADGTTTLDPLNNNIYIGDNSRGYNNLDSNSIVIGSNAIGKGANTIVIGNSSTTGTYLYGDVSLYGTYGFIANSSTIANVSSTNLTFVSATGSSLNANTAAFGVLTVDGQSVCLGSGTNCPATSTWYGAIELDRATSTALAFGSATGSSIFSTSGTIGTFGFGSATGTDLFSTTGRFDAVVTNAISSTGVTGTIQITATTTNVSGRLDAYQLNRWFQNPLTSISFLSGATTTVSNGPVAMAFDGTYMWVASFIGVRKVDPRTNTIVATIPTGSSPGGSDGKSLVYDGRYIWVGNYTSNNISKIDTYTNTVVATTTVPYPAEELAFDGTSVWATLFDGTNARLVKINPVTATVSATTTFINSSEVRNVIFDGKYIWARGSALYKINPSTAAIISTTTNLGGYGYGMAFDGRYIWTVNAAGSLSKIDPISITLVATIAIPGGQVGADILYDGRYIWVGSIGGTNGNRVFKFDPNTNALVDTFMSNGDTPQHLAFDGIYIWAANRYSNTVIKIPANGSVTGVNYLMGANIVPSLNNTFNLGNASNSWANIYASGTASLGNVVVSSTLTIGGQSVCLVNGTNCPATSTWYGAIELDRATSTALAFGSATGSSIFSTSGTIATLGFGSATGTDLFSTTGRFDAVITNAISSTGVTGTIQITATSTNVSGRLDAYQLNRWFQSPLLQQTIFGNRATTTVGGAPYGIAFDGTNIWVANNASSSLSKIDIRTNSVLATVPVQSGPRYVAFDGSSIWVAGTGGATTINKVDIHTNTVVATTTVGTTPRYMVFDGTYLWVANNSDGTVSKVNISTNTVVNTVTVGSNPFGLVFDGKYVWVGNNVSKTLSKIDISTDTVAATVPLSDGPVGMAFDGAFVWVSGANGLYKININSNTQVATTTIGVNPTDVIFDGSHIWAVNTGSNTISKIDINTNAVVASYGTGASPRYGTFDGSNIWIANSGSNTLTRISTEGGFGSTYLFNTNVESAVNNLWNLGSASNSWANIYASGTAYLANATVGSSLTVGGQSVCLANGTNCQATSTWYGVIALDRATSTALAFGSATGSSILSTSGTIATLGFGSATGTDLFSTTGRFDAVVTNAISSTGVTGTIQITATSTNVSGRLDAYQLNRWFQNPIMQIAFGQGNATTTVGTNPYGIAFDGAYMWVANFTSNNVSKIDVRTNAVVATIPVGVRPIGLAFDGAYMWVANSNSNNISKIDVRTNLVVATTTVTLPNEIAFDGTYIWTTNFTANTVSKIDPSTNAVIATIPVGSRSIGIDFDGAYMWVANFTSNNVSKIDIHTNAVVATTTVGTNPYGVAFDGAYVWITNSSSNTVSKIDIHTNAVVATTTVENPYAIAFDGAYMWVTSLSSQVVKIDVRTNAVVATISEGVDPSAIAFDGAYMWVANYTSNNVVKIPTGGSGTGADFLLHANLMPDSNNTWNLGSASNSWANIYASGTASLGNVVVSNTLTVGGQSVCLGNGTNCPATSTWYGVIALDRATSTALAFGSATGSSILSTSGTINLLGFGSATGSDLFSTTLRTTAFSADVTGATSTNFYWSSVASGTTLNANIATIGSLTSPSVTISGGTINGTTIGLTTPAAAIFTDATSTNLFATNGTFTNLTVTSLNPTNIIWTNATGTNTTSTNLFVSALLNAATVTSTNLYSNNGTIGALTVSSSTLANVSSTNLTFVTASGTTFNANVAGVGALAAQSVVSASSTLGNVSSTNLSYVTATGTTFNANTAAVGSLTVGGQSVCLANGTNCQATSTWYGAIALDRATSTALAFGSATGSSILSTSGTISLLGFGSATGSDLFSTTLRTTAFSADATGATSTNFYWSSVASGTTLNANVATIGSLTSPNVTISGGTINGTSIGLTTPAAAIFTDTTSTNLFATNGTFTNLTVSSLNPTGITWTNATGTNTTSTNLFFTNASGSSLSANAAAFGSVTVGGQSVCLSSGAGCPSAAATSTWYGVIALDRATSTALAFGSATGSSILSTSGTINLLGFGSATGTDLYATTIRTGALTAGATTVTSTNFIWTTSASGTTLNANIANIGQLNSPNVAITGGTINDTPIGAIASSTAIFSNTTSTNAAIANLTVSSTATLQGVSFTSATGSSILSTSGTINLLGFGSATGTDLYATTLRSSLVSSTQMNANAATFATITMENATATNLYFSGFATGTTLYANLSTIGGLTWVNATGTNTTSTNLYVSGLANLPSGTLVSGQNVCLQNGVNCPTVSVSSAWGYDGASNFYFESTNTASVIIGGTTPGTSPFYFQLQPTAARLIIGGNGSSTDVVIGASTSSGMHSAFQLTGDDLFVQGNIGSASSVYTNGEFVVGTGSTHYGDGVISKTAGDILFYASSVNPGVTGVTNFGSTTNKWNTLYAMTLDGQAVRDANGWISNSIPSARLTLGYNGGGFGGGLDFGRLPTATSSWSAFDPSANGVGSNAKGFGGAVSDGRYVYFAPQQNSGGYSGEVLRYDSSASFTSALSWSSYDPKANGVGTDPTGFSGAIFDGRYIYFVPLHNTTNYSGEVLRYDTQGTFATSTSWTSYSPKANGVGTDPTGFSGAVFDGKYIYFVPFHHTSDYSGEVLRYNTTASFTTAGSWTTFNPGSNGVGSIGKGYQGGVFDGRYLYLVPFETTSDVYHGEVMRFDTRGNFNSAASWNAYNPSANGIGTDATGYIGAAFDGRYIYFSPNHNTVTRSGEVLRLDTAVPFNATSSWSTFNFTPVFGTNVRGYQGALFDGRYVTFVPFENSPDYHDNVVTYDTLLPFSATTSWNKFNPQQNGVGTAPAGFIGGTFDGRYVYLAPYNNGDWSGEVERYDTGAPQLQQTIAQVARTSDLFIDSRGNVGIATTSTGSDKLTVNGSTALQGVSFTSATGTSIKTTSGTIATLGFDSATGTDLFSTTGRFGTAITNNIYSTGVTGTLSIVATTTEITGRLDAFGLNRWFQNPQLAQSFMGMNATSASIGTGLSGAVFDGAYVWVLRSGDSSISKIDVRTNEIVATVPLNIAQWDANYGAYDGHRIWVTNNGGNNIYAVDTTLNRVVATTTLTGSSRRMIFDGTYLWASHGGGTTVSKVSVTSTLEVATVTVGNDPQGLGFDGRYLYVSNYGDSTISKIDPVTNTVIATSDWLGYGILDMAFDGSYLWVTFHTDNVVQKIDPATLLSVATLSTGGSPDYIEYDGSYMWVTNNADGTVLKIDVRTNSIVKTYQTGSFPLDLAFDGVNMWVVGNGDGIVTKYPAGTSGGYGANFLVNGQSVCLANGTNCSGITWTNLAYPDANNTYSIGSATGSLANIYASGTAALKTVVFTNATGTDLYSVTGRFDTVCLSGNCQSSWPAGGTTSSWYGAIQWDNATGTNTTSTNLYVSNLLRTPSFSSDSTGSTSTNLYVSGIFRTPAFSANSTGATSTNMYVSGILSTPSFLANSTGASSTNFYVSGSTVLSSSTTINGQLVCLADGTNCPGNKAFFAYDQAGGIIIANTGANWTNIGFDSNSVTSTAFTFSIAAAASSTITFTATGTYRVTYYLGVQNTAASIATATSRLVEDTGSGAVELPGSRGSTYFTNTGAFVGNISVSVIRTFASGTTLTLQAQKLGTGNVKTVASSTGITIESIGLFSVIPTSIGGAGTVTSSPWLYSPTNDAIYTPTSTSFVGIGTSTPAYQLDVSGTVHVGKIKNVTSGAGAVTSTGGTITKDGSYWVHTFTTSGSFIPNGAVNVSVLVVGGGGAGGSVTGIFANGAGGGGGVIYEASHALTAQTYSVTVGTGGTTNTTQGATGGHGASSTFDTITADGGGGGGNDGFSGGNGGDGASGGGGAANNSPAGGSGRTGQGYGGASGSDTAPVHGGGGGGAGAAATDVNGAVGTSSAITGTTVYYGGGGGGGVSASSGAGTGGNGGGGNGGTSAGSATQGAANTGGGGGGGGFDFFGGNGGSGVVIVRYLDGASGVDTMFDYFTVGADGNIYIGTSTQIATTLGQPSFGQYTATIATGTNTGDVQQGGLFVYTSSTNSTSTFLYNAANNSRAVLDVRGGCTTGTNDLAVFGRTDDWKVASVKCNGGFYSDFGVTVTQGADYAEYFPSKDAALLHVGDLVALDRTTATSVIRGVSEERDQVIGVISRHSAYIGNAIIADQPNAVLVGMLGQLDTKVDAREQGIEIGDKLMMAHDGYAVKAKGPGMILGTAMEAIAQGATGTVMAYVSPVWWTGDLFTMLPDGSIRMTDAATTLSATTTASASITLVPSPFFNFESTAYDTTTTLVTTSVFHLQNVPISASSSLFTISSNATNTALLTVSDVGAVSFAGRFFPAGSIGMQSDASIFYDAATGTDGFMRTNAAGWAAKELEFSEMFPSHEDLKPGDVVVVDPNDPEYVKRSTSPYEGAVVGIVSTKPAFLAGEKAEGQFPISLSGRLPVQVSTENGPIKSGDYLVASSNAGVAMKATKAGPSVAIALQDYTGSSVSTTIQAYVYIGWYGGEGVGSLKSGVGSGTTEGTGFERHGFARIAAGDKQVKVAFDSVGNYPMITATPHGNPGSWWIQDESDTGFTIRLGAAQDTDVIFSWFASATPEGTTIWNSDADPSLINTTTGQPSELQSSTSGESTPATTTPSSDTTGSTPGDTATGDSLPSDSASQTSSTSESTGSGNATESSTPPADGSASTPQAESTPPPTDAPPPETSIP